MLGLLTWPVASNQRAQANARAAATELCRRRVEVEEVEAFLAEAVGVDRSESA